MAFCNRWVCKSTKEYELDNIKDILDGEKLGLIKGKKFELKHLVKLDPLISTNTSRYLPGTLFYEGEIENNYYDLTDSGDLEEHKDIQKTTYSVPFWISDETTILFRNSQAPTKDGKDLLSDIIFKKPNKIKNLNYDIEEIESDINSGILQGMWTSSFRDRLGNITSGVVYGENINVDSMYNQTTGAPKNFVGIEKTLNGSVVKITVSRKGTINILKDLDSVTDAVTTFETIEEFDKYGTLSK